jgi:hypothetical protein
MCGSFKLLVNYMSYGYIVSSYRYTQKSLSQWLFDNDL